MAAQAEIIEEVDINKESKMKRLVIIFLLILASVCQGRTVRRVKEIQGSVLHTIQSAWVVVDETTTTGTEPTALAKGERTKKLVDAAIATAASGDDEISTFIIPAAWNALRFRAVGTTDNDAMTHQVYLGTLGGEADCELVYAGQLVWTVGTKVSTYYQITFTSGGTYIPHIGDIATGNTSGKTAYVRAIPAAATNSFAAGTATGTIQYQSKSGTFGNDETVKMGDGLGAKADVLTHAGTSDLVGFEMADTLAITAKSWGASWSSVSPADDDQSAEAELTDLKGADYMVIVTSETSQDCKLLVKGY